MIKGRLPSLDGLRGISIILVIIAHLSYKRQIFVDTLPPKFLNSFFNFIQDGQLGVNMFFIISGFLITSLLLAEEKQTGTIALKKFYIRRTLRIFPAYYFLLLVYFIAQQAGFIYITSESWLTAITYTKYFNWQSDWYTGHAWSLSIEEHFYLFWPFIFLLGDISRKSVAVFFILIVPFIRIYVYYNPIDWLNELTFFLRIDSIATGCLFALYKDQLLTRISSNYWKPIVVISFLILFFLPYMDRFTNLVPHLSFIWIPLGLRHGTIGNIVIGFIMIYAVYISKGLLFKFLNNKVLRFIGVLSYSIYLWQQLFIMDTNYWFNATPINLVLIFAAALASYYLIEKPFLRLKSRF